MTQAEMPTQVDWPQWMPDQILPGLFQGGTADEDVISAGTWCSFDRSYPFDLVVTLYANANPVPWGVPEIRFGFPDAEPRIADLERVRAIARIAYTTWQTGQRVLIRCQAGVNRSGLTSALVLMLHGYSAAEAIALLRERRGLSVLCNPDFEDWLLADAADFLASTDDSPAA